MLSPFCKPYAQWLLSSPSSPVEKHSDREKAEKHKHIPIVTFIAEAGVGENYKLISGVCDDCTWGGVVEP